MKLSILALVVTVALSCSTADRDDAPVVADEVAIPVSDSNDPETGSIVAEVNGRPLHRGFYQQHLMYLRDRLGSEGNNVEDYINAKFDAFANLIDNELIFQQAEKRGKTISDTDLFAEIELSLPGRHNVANALAAIAISHHAGASAESVRDSLWNFAGVRRRFEHIGSWRGMTLIDDYAHHPTAITKTIEAVREKFPDNKIIVAFHPHLYSRTRDFMDGFAKALSHADEVVLAPVYAAREKPIEGVTSEELAKKINSLGTSATALASLDEVCNSLLARSSKLEARSLIITMGAGDIYKVAEQITEE